MTIVAMPLPTMLVKARHSDIELVDARTIAMPGTKAGLTTPGCPPG